MVTDYTIPFVDRIMQRIEHARTNAQGRALVVTLDTGRDEPEFVQLHITQELLANTDDLRAWVIGEMRRLGVENIDS